MLQVHLHVADIVVHVYTCSCSCPTVSISLECPWRPNVHDCIHFTSNVGLCIYIYMCSAYNIHMCITHCYNIYYDVNITNVYMYIQCTYKMYNWPV